MDTVDESRTKLLASTREHGKIGWPLTTTNFIKCVHIVECLGLGTCKTGAPKPLAPSSMPPI